MGGIWEAAVKSMKFHLRRVLGEATTNFEDLDTLLKGIEACLNSHSICPERTDPNAMWQRILQMRPHFWNRWKDEYLCQLQRRVKWIKPHSNLKIGDMVVIKEENLPPQNWRLGRVMEAHVDPTDEIALVRAVTVRTANGNFKRPVQKLVLLSGSEIECEEGTSECLK
ncbi:unnamed protein product [Allacma fusca]|uniref:DUF5641 domain-containing protein n=1 Tax=Allacma fusca TaxID=39272 RepID=A0A8J2KDC8_9HEXA|nr:unnamed protein product [Allacma fusca]